MGNHEMLRLPAGQITSWRSQSTMNWDFKVSELCRELGITRQTLYRHVGPDGSLREYGRKLLERRHG
ncbi:hypothetical protein [Azospirillum sp. sgz302134]